jgi:hypothetical protein
VQPFDLDDSGSLVGAIAAAVVVLALAAIAFAKGRILLGAISIFVPVVGLYAAVRLARPGSPWASRRYRGDQAHKLERARERFGAERRGEVVERRLLDAIGGAPSIDRPKAP